MVKVYEKNIFTCLRAKVDTVFTLNKPSGAARMPYYAILYMLVCREER